MLYEYVRFQTDDWRRAAHAAYDGLRRDVEPAGGVLYGVWRGVIGAPADQGVLMLAYPDPRAWAERRAGPRRYEGLILLDSALLLPSTRPERGSTAAPDGLHAHRWFRIRPGSFQEFARLSEAGWWPVIEADGARIQGLWSARGGAAEGDALLITRYESMAHWEATRYATPEARSRLAPDARRAMEQRGALTLGSVVRIMRPVPPP